MKAKQALISVIIPTYNRLPVLRRALQALDQQSEEGRPFEVIVVDDGCSDGTAGYLGEAAFTYPFLHLRQGHRGPAAARNLALQAAVGELALFLNDDCLASPELLAQHRKHRPPGEECTVLGHIAWSPEVEFAPELRALLEDNYFSYQRISDPDHVPFTFFITGNLSTPLRLVREAGGFDESFSEAAFEDIDLGYRLQRMGLGMRYNPKALAFHLHQLDFDQFCLRQQKISYWFCAFLAKHSEARAYYHGLQYDAHQFPVTKVQCLRVILNYMGYRGMREGYVDFLACNEGKPFACE